MLQNAAIRDTFRCFQAEILLLLMMHATINVKAEFPTSNKGRKKTKKTNELYYKVGI